MNRPAFPFPTVGLPGVRLLGMGAALLATVPAHAADLSVEEFDAMTRITIPALDEGEWIVNASVRAFDMRIGEVELDLTAPTLSDDSRLSALETWEGKTDTGISIRFTCDCRTSHFYGEGGTVIVDVAERATSGAADGDAPAPAPPVSVTSGWNRTTSSMDRRDTAPARPALLEMVQAALLRTAPMQAAPVQAAPVQALPVHPLPLLPAPPRTIPMQPASSVQVVPFRNAPVRTSAPVRTPAPTGPVAPGGETVFRTPVPLPKPAGRAPSFASTPDAGDASIDALREAVLARLAVGVEQGRITMDARDDAPRRYVPEGCPDEAALDLKRLIGSDDFRAALPALRADVYDEMKQVNPAAVRTLARHFIAFGLGEEARNVIAAFDGKGAAEKLIVEMATVLEGDGKTMSSGLLIKPECGPRAAVWRAMVAAQSETGTVRAIYDEARNTVLDLPDPLRKILGARIAIGLIDEGDREAAMRLWRNMENATGPNTPELAMLEAHVDEGLQLDRLLALARSRSPLAGEAAMRAAAMLLENEDRARAERLGSTLEDLAFIYRDTDAETSLSLTLAQLQARYGDLASALTALAKKADDDPDRAEHWRSIARETIRVATEAADPVARPHDFDTILASLRHLDDSPSSDAAKFSLVRKLMNVGGAHIVESVLTPTIRARAPEARRLLAEARLLMGDATGARRLLAGLKDEGSEALQARTATLSASGSAETTRGRFAPVDEAPRRATISGARELMEKTEEDLSIIEELLADG